MAEIVLNIAFVFYVGSSWLRSDLWLRIVLMLSSVCSTIAGILIGSPSMIAWNGAFVVLMGWRVGRVLLQRRSIELSGEETWIRSAVFPDLSPIDFVRLWEMGEDRVYEDAPLVVEGEATEELMLVLSGAPNVRRNGRPVATLWSGQFAGEMAFATQAPANATVVPGHTPVRCRVWSTARLRGLVRTSPEIAAGLEQAISVDLAGKLSSADDAAGRRVPVRF